MDAIPPGAWAVIGIVVTAIAGVLWGKNSHRRDSSATKLAEAQDSRQIGQMTREDAEIVRLNAQIEKLIDREERALKEVQRLKDEDAKRLMRESQEAVAKMQKQLDKALPEIEPDRLARLALDSAFMVHDRALRAPPPPRAPAPPQDPFQAARPYEPPVVWGRRATDVPTLQDKYPAPLHSWTDKPEGPA